MDIEKSKVAIFRSFRPWLNKDSKSLPSPTQTVIPDWYKDADRFAKMPNGEYWKAPKEICPFPKEGTTDDYGKIPTWKACPAIMDAFLFTMSFIELKCITNNNELLFDQMKEVASTVLAKFIDEKIL